MEPFSSAAESEYDKQCWWKAGAREAQDDMEEIEVERLPLVEALESQPSRKEHLEIRYEICYTCS